MAKSLAKYFSKVEGDGEYTTVEIVSAMGNIITVKVGGEQYEVDYALMGRDTHSLIINDHSYAVQISKHDTIYDVQRADDLFRVEILDEMKKFIKEKVSKGLQGRQIIETQMPGLILKVLVEKGQEVKTGDPLLILVAMKMENEIKSPKDGVVQEIFISDGQTVGTGDKLVIVE